MKRVLRDDGTVWLNLGDSYAGSWGNYGAREGKQREQRAVKYERHAWDDFVQRPPMSHKVPGLKPKDLVGIPWRVAFALQADGWWLRSDIIWSKCLSGGAIVYAKTQKGEMPMMVKDMIRLDPATVELWDGKKWNQVAGWQETKPDKDRKTKSLKTRRARYEGKHAPVLGDIEIELRNGERIGCTRNHKWPTQHGLVLAENLAIGDVIESTQLPEPQGVRTPSHLPDSEVGWFIGTYIADGSQSQGTIQISSHISETSRYDRLCRLALAYDGYCSKSQTSPNGMVIIVNSPVLLGIIQAYVFGKNAKTKHLNVRAWKRSNNFLHSVLMGYLEGDGHNASKGRWCLGMTTNDALVSDLRVICARLNYSLRLKRCKHKCQSGEFRGWRGDLYFDPNRRKTNDREIMAVRQSRARTFWKISLIDDPHLFSLASGTLTGNSNPMPESVTDRPTKAHEYVFLLSKNARYFYDADAVREAQTGNTHSRGLGDGGPKARASEGTNIRGKQSWAESTRTIIVPGGRNRRTVWKANPQIWRLKAGLSDDDQLYVLGELVRRGLLPSNPNNNDGRP